MNMASYSITAADRNDPDSITAADRNDPDYVTEAQLVVSLSKGGQLSRWSSSAAKRLFDVVCVISALPMTVPVLLLTALAVRMTSKGPVLFRQQRMGRHGQPFTILKFRTMPVRSSEIIRPLVTSSTNQKFTPVGPFLRRWKLDELPQIFNVLNGEMSLVGPRPKLPEHQHRNLACRPGITGYATYVFAREEGAFAGLSERELHSLYHEVVLPFKEQLDREYMSSATCVSDLRLVLKSVFRKWNNVALEEIPLCVTSSADVG
jgi:lipopolysaccharide/colanic/teichoic acid biosynthesis glycosyltransferase